MEPCDSYVHVFYKRCETGENVIKRSEKTHRERERIKKKKKRERERERGEKSYSLSHTDVEK